MEHNVRVRPRVLGKNIVGERPLAASLEKKVRFKPADALCSFSVSSFCDCCLSILTAGCMVQCRVSAVSNNEKAKR